MPEGSALHYFLRSLQAMTEEQPVGGSAIGYKNESGKNRGELRGQRQLLSVMIKAWVPFLELLPKLPV
jgi:hypothetical protein